MSAITDELDKIESAVASLRALTASPPPPPPPPPPGPPPPPHPPPPAGGLVPLGAHRPDSPEIARLRGCIVTMDSLFNSNFGVQGGTVKRAYHVFRAAESGTPVSLRLYHEHGDGYSGGDGGDFLIKIARIDDHRPVADAPAFATATWKPPMSGGKFPNSNDRFKTHPLSATGRIEKGGLYQIEYQSTDPTNGNYSNVDDSAVLPMNGSPFLSLPDFAVWAGRKSGGGWSLTDETKSSYYIKQPNFELLLDSGKRLGNMGFACATNSNALAATQPFRTRLVLDQPWNVVGLTLFGSFDVPGSLDVSIVAGGKLVGSGEITESKKTSGTIAYSIPMIAQIPAGESFILYTPRGSTVRVRDRRDGRSYGFGSLLGETQRFNAQWFNGSKWIGRNMYSPAQSSTGSHWQDVLHLDG